MNPTFYSWRIVGRVAGNAARLITSATHTSDTRVGHRKLMICTRPHWTCSAVSRKSQDTESTLPTGELRPQQSRTCHKLVALWSRDWNLTRVSGPSLADEVHGRDPVSMLTNSQTIETGVAIVSPAIPLRRK